MTALSRARLIAVLVPAALLGGALASQYIGHLVPCEMCMWQRWPHLAALVLALIAVLLRSNPKASRGFTLLAALGILISGAIGVYHAGVEYHWWTGITRCTAPVLGGPGQDILAQVMAAPVVRCDQTQWTLWGVSLAGWNALFSLVSGASILWLIAKPTAR
ncbi:disulfide bond formation protein B [Sphingomonas sp. PR090111-T3T-6A]|uniref:disulfide bond formation protein B n=1 Tax=Sphingomonas sp. PR090111-T3T-6A TaxID=685778 RepID=UPI00036E39CA|nr:disulfide bond formation protein B [Sphingomonas sp. PR090111-T3T-6A]